ncbi:hypothetical protein psal_cds_374 [Pandoravirus salinus]|uniref:E3 ubiquitin-protein ligase TTC3/DZIP3 domain-containing protein n=1 Tax=Pandoravirus salinus TaxID=1349410 RepID=S4VU65_9VIRU|nr:hypothetical protein psal_cds_374 [Pandoravirus salinus]AGO84049.1 hypothetical protein psal_cds_374 [Pandoravirus salinus]
MQRTDDHCDPRQRHKDTDNGCADDRAHDDGRNREKNDHSRGRDNGDVAGCGGGDHPAQQRVRDKIDERPCAVVCAPRPQPPLADGRHFLVAEIHGCYRPAWRVFAMAAAVTAGACRGFVGRRVPAGTRIASAIAFHDPRRLCLDGASLRPALDAHPSFTFDRIVMVLSWPGGSNARDVKWVAASFGNASADVNGSDPARDHTVDGRSRVDPAVAGRGERCVDDGLARAIYRKALDQAARITRESLTAAVETLLNDRTFRKQHGQRESGDTMPIERWYKVCEPTLTKSVAACPDGTLKRACGHTTTNPSCAECDAVWTHSENLQSDTRGAARCVPLRQLLRQAVAGGVALDEPVAAIARSARRLVTATEAAKTTAQTIPKAVPKAGRRVAIATVPRGARAEEVSSVSAGPRCGRATCPSPSGRVDPSVCALVRVRCTAGCRVAFHRACWRAVADRALAHGDQSPCVTPDCWGSVVRVVSLAPYHSGDPAGPDTRAKHVEWQAKANPIDHHLEKKRAHSQKRAAALVDQDNNNSKTTPVECEPRAMPTGAPDKHSADTTTRAPPSPAVADDSPVDWAGDTRGSLEWAPALDVVAHLYRKDRRQEGTAPRAKPKRTRARAQKRQRVRARQKVDLLGLPDAMPWTGDDDLWPSFFVDDAGALPATAIPTQARVDDAERPVRSPTVWRFATWYPSSMRAPPKRPSAAPVPDRSL